MYKAFIALNIVWKNVQQFKSQYTDFQKPIYFLLFQSSIRAWGPDKFIMKSYPTKSELKKKKISKKTNNAFSQPLSTVTKCYLHTFNIQLTGMISKIYKNENFCRYMIRRYTNCITLNTKAVWSLQEKSSQYPLVEMLYKNVSH